MAFVEKKLPADAPVAAKALNWVDSRFPLTKLWNDQWGQYYAPKNLNFWYIFGSLAMLVLVIQIVTGIFLVMHYKPDANLAFASVEYIMRDVPWGWLIRYLHSTGASALLRSISRALIGTTRSEPWACLTIFASSSPPGRSAAWHRRISTISAAISGSE